MLAALCWYLTRQWEEGLGGREEKRKKLGIQHYCEYCLYNYSAITAGSCYVKFVNLFLSTGITEEYELPFEYIVPHDPSFDDMREAIVLKGITPDMPDHWNQDEVIHFLVTYGLR